MQSLLGLAAPCLPEQFVVKHVTHEEEVTMLFRVCLVCWTACSTIAVLSSANLGDPPEGPAEPEGLKDGPHLPRANGNS